MKIIILNFRRLHSQSLEKLGFAILIHHQYNDFNDFHINIRGWIIIHHVIKALMTLQFRWVIFRKILTTHNGIATEKGVVY